MTWLIVPLALFAAFVFLLCQSVLWICHPHLPLSFFSVNQCFELSSICPWHFELSSFMAMVKLFDPKMAFLFNRERGCQSIALFVPLEEMISCFPKKGEVNGLLAEGTLIWFESIFDPEIVCTFQWRWRCQRTPEKSFFSQWTNWKLNAL